METVSVETQKNGSGEGIPRPFACVQSRRVVDYALRTVQQSQVQFSLMADAKANIMITVCSLVLTVAVTQLEKTSFQFPLCGLIGFTLAALLMAILCVLPSSRYPRDQAGKVNRHAPSFNLLFFMHFAHLSSEDYARDLEALLADDARLYEALIRDIYGQGVILARRKYRLLRWSYLSFLAGLFVSAALLVWQLFSAAG